MVVPGDLTVAGWRRRKWHAGAGGATAILAAHAAGATVHAIVGDRPDDQRKIQDELLTSWDVQVDLTRGERDKKLRFQEEAFAVMPL